MRSRADAQVNIWFRQAQIAEESVRHLRIVMLPCMHDERREIIPAPLHSFDNGRDLHEVGSRADNVDDLKHVPSSMFQVSSPSADYHLEHGTWNLQLHNRITRARLSRLSSPLRAF